MNGLTLAGGTVHAMPKDLRKALAKNAAARAAWEYAAY
jgi:hypothetical protein